MKHRKDESPRALIALGAASRDTHGPVGFMPEAGGLWHKAGLSRD